MKRTLIAAGVAGLLIAPGAQAIDMQIGGYVQLDSIYSSFSEGRVATGSGRDFYVPALIPVESGAGSYDALDFHAKNSRLYFKGGTTLDNGDKVGTTVEMDFIVTGGLGGDERITNAYTPGLRRAFLTYNNWLFGQEWSTLQNLTALPEGLDFLGPSDSTIFVRQAQVRYTMGDFKIALENPETTITPYGGGTRIVADDSVLPDLIARYDFKVGPAALSVAGVLRELRVDQGGADDSKAALGGTFSGKIGFGKDDLRFMISGGDLGRYVAINTSNGAVLDADNKLHSISQLAGYAAYRHLWNEQWRSNFTAAFFSADNKTDLTGTAVTKSVQSFRANLLYSPAKDLTFGVEYTHANREIESGADGDLDRVQFSAKYMFATN